MSDDHSYPGISILFFSKRAVRSTMGVLGATGGGAKRTLDVIVASIAILLLLPLLIMLMIMVRFSMGGPVFYCHPRIGLGGQTFRCWKFRTMVTNGDHVLATHLDSCPEAAEEWRRTRKLANDPRITFVGHLLRSSSLDELPQLVNVLRGDMSCVGPRPIVQDELALYGAAAADYLKARPGMTGAWQVSGRSSLSYAERVAIDSHYVQTWSLWTDLLILMRTIPALLRTHQTS